MKIVIFRFQVNTITAASTNPTMNNSSTNNDESKRDNCCITTDLHVEYPKHICFACAKEEEVPCSFLLRFGFTPYLQVHL